MTGSPEGRPLARADVGATATVGVTEIANAVSSASASAAGVLRRTLIVLPPLIMSVRNREPNLSQPSGAPQQGQREPRSRVGARLVALKGAAECGSSGATR